MPKNADRATAIFWTKVDRKEPDACWLWKASFSDTGYGNARIYKRAMGAHRAAWILTHGEIPNGLCVLHKCDVRACCNPSHFFLGTKKDNLSDMAAKGRSARGEKQHCSVLTADQVRIIRGRHASGEPMSRIAAEYGVVPATVSDAVKRITWAHID